MKIFGIVMKIVAALAAGVLIGKTTRSFRGFNNTLTLCPALISTKSDIEELVAGIDAALTTIMQIAVRRQFRRGVLPEENQHILFKEFGCICADLRNDCLVDVVAHFFSP